MCELDEQLRQLIEILSKALQCGNLSTDQINLTRNVQNTLNNLLQPIVGLEDSTLIPNEKQPSILSMLTPFAKFNVNGGGDRNGTGAMIPNSVNLSNLAIPTPTTTADSTTVGGTGLKIHTLEIFKVVVLIIVISIILISTCRMVLRLLLRSRPEKSYIQR